VFSNSQVVDAQSSNWLTYENSQGGFKILYPPDWKWEIPPEINPMVVFLSPPDSFEASAVVFVTVENVADFTLDEYTQLTIEGAKQSPFFSLIESSKTELAGFSAQKIVYTDQIFSEPINFITVITVADGIGYGVTYLANPDLYSDYLQTGQQMIDSFEISQYTGKQVSGKYVNSEVGLEIELPEGWGGMETKTKVTTVFLTPGFFINPFTESAEMSVMIEFVAMVIMIGEASDILSELEQTSPQIDCQPSSAKIVYVNEMKATAAFSACDIPDLGKAQGIDYTFATKEKVIVVSYVALSSDPNKAYESEISKFEDSLNTLKIKNTIDVSEPSNYAHLFGYTHTSYAVLVENKMREIEIVSHTRIGKFSFNEADNEISFKIVPQEDTTEETTVYVDDFLNPPYTVLDADYKEINDFIVLDDQTSDRVGISFWDHKGSFTIKGSTITPAPVRDQVAKLQIPDWIRNNAKWWSEGAIGDNDFTSGIQFLIKEGIMQIPETAQPTREVSAEGVPDWVRNNAGWWADGLISDDDFVSGIKYLVEQGIIKV